jgi:hypothetical protein
LGVALAMLDRAIQADGRTSSAMAEIILLPSRIIAGQSVRELKGIVGTSPFILHCGKCETFQRFRVSIFFDSRGRCAEDAAAENFAHQRASHRAAWNRMKASPHASTAEQIQRVVGQVGPRHAPHPFRHAAMCARVDYARGARARYGRFYNSHGSIIPDRSVLSKSHSPQFMASGRWWHRPRRSCLSRPGVRQREVQFKIGACRISSREVRLRGQPEIRP